MPEIDPWVPEVHKRYTEPVPQAPALPGPIEQPDTPTIPPVLKPWTMVLVLKFRPAVKPRFEVAVPEMDYARKCDTLAEMEDAIIFVLDSTHSIQLPQ